MNALIRVADTFREIIALGEVDVLNSDIVCSQVAKMTGTHNVNVQIQIVNAPRIIAAARRGIEVVRQLERADHFCYDPDSTWREFKTNSRRWFLERRLKEPFPLIELAAGLGLQRAYLYQIRKRLGLDQERTQHG